MAVQISSKIRDRLAYAALVRLRREIGAAPVANDVTIDTILFVDLTGDDATAIKGDLNRPWRHVQAAVDAALAGETIMVMPGHFPEAVVVPPTVGLRLVGQGTVGQGYGITNITSVSFLPTVDVDFLLMGVTVLGPATIDGSAIPDAFQTMGCRVSQCYVDGGLVITRLNRCDLEDVGVNAGFTSVNSRFTANRCDMDTTTDFVDWAQPVPNLLAESMVTYSDLGPLVVSTHAQLRADFCTMRNTILNTVEDALGHFGTLAARSCNTGAISVMASLLNPRSVLQANSCVLDGFTSDGSAGGVRAACYVRSSDLGYLPVVAGYFIDLDIMGSAYQQSQLANAGPGPNQGCIERPLHVIGGNVAPAPGGIIPIVPPFVTAIYAAPWDNQSGLPDADVIVSGKLNDGFTAAGYRPGSTGTPSLLTGTFALTLYK